MNCWAFRDIPVRENRNFHLEAALRVGYIAVVRWTIPPKPVRLGLLQNRVLVSIALCVLLVGSMIPAVVATEPGKPETGEQKQLKKKKLRLKDQMQLLRRVAS